MPKRRKTRRPDTLSASASAASVPHWPALRWRLLVTAITLVGGIVVIAFWHRWNSVQPLGAQAAPQFAGSNACAGCHAKEADAWRGSQHARAMQDANERTVLGDFGDRTFEHAGVVTTFYQRDGRFFVRTDGPDGKLADYRVKYTFGIEPLQQYLLELPGGRLQAFTIAWDTRAQRWLDLYQNEKLAAGDELHWTGRQQNWNFMCADCHSTAVRKNYDPQAQAYATTWTEISVGCESCHGPGSNHIAWTTTKQGDPRKGLMLALDERDRVTWSIDSNTGNARRSRPRDADKEIQVCAQCHARRVQIAESYFAGTPFLDHYLPAFLTAPLYHADGQQRDEVYVWGSFLQSRMNRAGVTCSDCHDPHTQQLKAPGNAVCMQCHSAAKYDAKTHHFHEPSGRAGQCVACHMPTATYMVVDPRRDHSLRVPRPDLTVALGVPNACNACHRETEARWAAEAVRRWYGRDAGGFQTFARTFWNAERGKPNTDAALAEISTDRSQSPFARASALIRLDGQLDPAVTAARAAARDADPLVRLAAARLADSLPPRERVTAAGPLLGDPLRAVRIEAAHALAGVPERELTADQRMTWERAADEYVATQRYNADRPEAHANLGSFYARRGRFDEAQAEFRAAIALDRRFVPAYVNAADAYRQQAREDDALRMLQEGLAVAPISAPLHHAVGLARARKKQSTLALQALERATRLAPDNARYAYVYAVALNSFGRAPEAIRNLELAAARWPANRDILFALATMQRDAGRRDAARRAAEALVAAFPRDADARALIEQLK